MPDQYVCTKGDVKFEVQRFDTNEQHLAANVVSIKAESIPVARDSSSVETCRAITTTEILEDDKNIPDWNNRPEYYR